MKRTIVSVFATAAALAVSPTVSAIGASAQPRQPAQAQPRPPAYAKCAACHSVVKGGPSGAGPNLHGVAGRKAGALPNYNYSAALKKSGITWNDSSLDHYIADPNAAVPGGKMFKVPTTPAERAAIIAYLSGLEMNEGAVTPAAYVARPFGTFAELFAIQASLRADHPAIICGDDVATYRVLERLADRVASGLQRDGVRVGGAVAICAAASIDYAAIFIGTLRAGAAICPLSPSATPAQLLAMIEDCGASHLFTDGEVSLHLEPVIAGAGALRIALDGEAGGTPIDQWLPPADAAPAPVAVEPDQAFNIIYSSGTTGTPKGIVQSHRMRWPHNNLADPPGYGPDAVAMISTPLYSNTTLVSFIPALAGGGTVILMPKFDARRFAALSDRHRATHAMLVPVQYRRILDVEDFDRFDLSRYQLKFATSAPFPAELKAEVLRRWPGGLIEYYGMTEGGGSCMLVAHEHPDKLATVGQPMPGHDIRVIDGDGKILPPGKVGEVVGRSGAMMSGYHNRPEQTAEAEWFSPQGDRFIRTGDLAVVDAEGFFTLIGRKKDMIISGGINIYPVDLEEALLEHPAVREAAVVAARSREWGETPVGFVALMPGATADAEALASFANDRLGRMQRLSEVRIVDELPRSAVGKILKRELQDRLSVETALIP